MQSLSHYLNVDILNQIEMFLPLHLIIKYKIFLVFLSLSRFTHACQSPPMLKSLDLMVSNSSPLYFPDWQLCSLLLSGLLVHSALYFGQSTLCRRKGSVPNAPPPTMVSEFGLIFFFCQSTPNGSGSTQK